MSTLNQETLIPINKNLENYFANSIVPQLFVDSDMILQGFTPPAGKYFSIAHEDIGKSIHIVKEKIRHKTIIENIRGVMLTERNRKNKIQTTDGRLFEMNIQPYFCQRDEELQGVIITYLDLTGQIATMKELEKLNAEHETLMFALSHDIKQPLSTIILLSDALLEAYRNQDATLFEKWNGNLKRTANNIKFLVDQIIEPHPSGEAAILSKEQVSFKAVFRDVSGMLREEVQNNQVSIDTNFRVENIKFSENNLRSMIYNLLWNAIKYKNPEKNLHISLSTRKVGENVMLSVQDNGIGISMENQKNIFKKSARFNSSIEGTGMGLYIIKRMMDNCDGEIEVDSTLGIGSNFKIYFRE